MTLTKQWLAALTMALVAVTAQAYVRTDEVRATNEASLKDQGLAAEAPYVLVTKVINTSTKNEQFKYDTVIQLGTPTEMTVLVDGQLLQKKTLSSNHISETFEIPPQGKLEVRVVIVHKK